jgi:hypothetical protein
MLAGWHLALSKMAPALQLKVAGFFMPQNAEARQGEEQKQMWQLASARRLQLIILAQGYNLSHYLKVSAY